MKNILLIVSVSLLIGCGTVVHGSRQTLAINTSPPGLTVIVAGKSSTTPCSLDVPRSSEHATILKPDGSQIDVSLEREFNFWTSVAGNFWNYIILGLIVDRISGAAYTIDDVDIKIPIQ